ncbi:futalosine hydrolase [Paenibacillus sp. J5C_2022]|uniref:futalosine hydrolase n=1 Tax=Paenibacillus sp. J5C2022 TaxID=2977129 RepID=UPI0021D1D0C3|nr:futalosine hydrolase [Paenibacillus sp. J5C2022]MCU6710766.1 futalosine hydrolase [Paenibacillus sp. J5C2022]
MTQQKNQCTQAENGRVPRILVVTAVDAERDAVLRGLDGDTNFTVIAGGVGPATAAVSAALELAASPSYELVISAGIGGGFSGAAELGTLVLADAVIAADLGAETAEGFIPLDELGFGTASLPVSEAWRERLHGIIRQSGLPLHIGPVLTVSTVTGTAETAELRAELVPGAAAEAMEGYGVAQAAAKLEVPFAELRSISNAVGPRDRAAWRIGDAMQALENAFSAIRFIAKEMDQ